uniref:Uncharacterized protein n=1 Tax=Arundo donax TaxID=35708 RepID=A0A0A9DDS5_ARUDO
MPWRPLHPLIRAARHPRRCLPLRTLLPGTAAPSPLSALPDPGFPARWPNRRRARRTGRERRARGIEASSGQQPWSPGWHCRLVEQGGAVQIPERQAAGAQCGSSACAVRSLLHEHGAGVHGADEDDSLAARIGSTAFVECV